jgi:hypothetical protein
MPIITTNKGDAPKRIILKPGEHNFEVVDANEKKSEAGNDYIELKLRVGEEQASVYDNLVFTDAAMWKVSQFLYATGLAKSEGESINLVEEDCLGLTGRCLIKTGKDKNKQDRNEIDSYLFEEF